MILHTGSRITVLITTLITVVQVERLFFTPLLILLLFTFAVYVNFTVFTALDFIFKYVRKKHTNP